MRGTLGFEKQSMDIERAPAPGAPTLHRLAP
jgi:hypothetical protein